MRYRMTWEQHSVVVNADDPDEAREIAAQWFNVPHGREDEITTGEAMEHNAETTGDQIDQYA